LKVLFKGENMITNDIMENIISNEKSNWREKAEFRKDNKAWLDKSAIIALKILNHIRDNGISQKQLAEMIKVSPQFINKVVKGSENLTLQTISNIESALGITLIEVVSTDNRKSLKTFRENQKLIKTSKSSKPRKTSVVLG